MHVELVNPSDDIAPERLQSIAMVLCPKSSAPYKSESAIAKGAVVTNTIPATNVFSFMFFFPEISQTICLRHSWKSFYQKAEQHGMALYPEYICEANTVDTNTALVDSARYAKARFKTKIQPV